MRLGYIRVSTEDQNTSRQLDGVQLDKVYIDKLSGKNTNRPGLQQMLSEMRPGDIILVHSLDRLARSQRDLLDLAERIHAAGCSLHAGGLVIGNDAYGRMTLGLLGAFAQFEREMIVTRVKEGCKKASDNGIYMSRTNRRRRQAGKENLDVDGIRSAKASGMSIKAICAQFGVSAPTIYNHL